MIFFSQRRVFVRLKKLRFDPFIINPRNWGFLMASVGALASGLCLCSTDQNRKNSLLQSENSNKFVVSVCSVKGERPAMEDTYYVSSNKSFSAVFDGHGGVEIAQFLKEKLYHKLYNELKKAQEDVKDINLETVYLRIFSELSSTIDERKQWNHIGSTALSMLCLEDKLWFANLGDCRAVLCRKGKAIDMTIDHKPNNIDEKKRIEALGGKVKWFGWVDTDNNPIKDMGVYRINGNLAVSRAFGDKDQKPFVSCIPEISCIQRNPGDDQFVILASDGLWDVLESEEVVMFINNILDAQIGGRGSWRSGQDSKTSTSLAQWKSKYSNDSTMIQAAIQQRKKKMAQYIVQEALARESTDNITVVIIWFQ